MNFYHKNYTSYHSFVQPFIKVIFKWTNSDIIFLTHDNIVKILKKRLSKQLQDLITF